MDEALGLTRVMLAGTMTAAPIVRTGADGDVAVLKVKIDTDEDGERLEWVRAEGNLARFVAEKGWGEGTALLVLGRLASRTSTDRTGHERTEYYTLVHRIARDEFATWSQSHAA